MALPRQVEAVLRETEALEKQLGYVAEEQPEVVAEVVTPKVVQDANPKPKVVKEPEAQQDEADVEEVAVEAKPEKVESEEDAKVWKQKYKTLQGMYDAEVPRLHAQVKELNANLDSLRAELAQQQQVVEKAEAITSLVTDDDVQTFGEDLIEVQRKVAREVAAEFKAELDALKKENTKLREQMESTSSKVSESSFMSRLYKLVPDFEEVNTSAEWIEWLNEFDPIIRGPRMSVAQQAYEAGDADAVAHYVKLFKDGQAPKPQPKSQKKEVEQQIQPSRSATSTAQTSQKGRVYSSANIQDMFKQVVNLSNVGRVDEARQLEAEIDAAYMEGRVRG